MNAIDLDRLAAALDQEPQGESLAPPAAMSAEAYDAWVVAHWQSLTPQQRKQAAQRAASQRVQVAFELHPTT